MSDEHYLPRALGKFQGLEPLRNRVCRECNSEIGKLETQFLRAGHVGFFRWLLGIHGYDELPPSPFYKGSLGTKPIYMLGRTSEMSYDILWENYPGTEEIFPLRQIVFYHPLVGHRPAPIFDWMKGNPNGFREYLESEGLDQWALIQLFAAEEEISWVEALIRTIGGDPPKHWGHTEFRSPQRLQLIAHLNVTNAYFQAIAKVGFHYTLKMFPDLTGHEYEFSKIKDYIWSGEGENFVVEHIKPFVENFNLGYRPTHWMHILAVEKSPDRIIARAQFFVGPRSMPPSYEIKIGKDPRNIIGQPEIRSHQFVITDSQNPSGPIGVMEDAQPITHVITPRFF